MRILFILILSFITSVAIAADTIFVSSLTNGTPPTLNVAKFSRTAGGPLNFVSSISLTLPKAGGVTSIQPNGDTQLHIYRTELVGSKARIVRETVDSNTFTFVAGSTVATPANLSTLHNFDSNDALALSQKQTGTLLHIRQVNPAVNVTGGFRVLPSLPAAPFGARISDGAPFFFSALWIDPTSRRTGVTFSNTTAPFNTTSFLFTNPILAHDVSLSFPRPSGSALANDDDPPKLCFYFFIEGVGFETDNVKVAGRIFERQSQSSPGQIHTSDFTPVGNVITIAPSRSIGSSANAVPFQFNGIGVDPLAIAIAYLRWNAAANANEIILQTFNPVTKKKVGPAKIAKPAVRNFVNYGLSVFNVNFKNGVTPD